MGNGDKRVFQFPRFDTKPKTIEGHVLQVDRETDPQVRDRLVNELRDFVKSRKKLRDYMLGIQYTIGIGKQEVNQDLRQDMMKNYPRLGKIVNLFI